MQWCRSGQESSLMRCKSFQCSFLLFVMGWEHKGRGFWCSRWLALGHHGGSNSTGGGWRVRHVDDGNEVIIVTLHIEQRERAGCWHRGLDEPRPKQVISLPLSTFPTHYVTVEAHFVTVGLLYYYKSTSGSNGAGKSRDQASQTIALPLNTFSMCYTACILSMQVNCTILWIYARKQWNSKVITHQMNTGVPSFKLLFYHTVACMLEVEIWRTWARAIPAGDTSPTFFKQYSRLLL